MNCKIREKLFKVLLNRYHIRPGVYAHGSENETERTDEYRTFTFSKWDKKNVRNIFLLEKNVLSFSNISYSQETYKRGVNLTNQQAQSAKEQAFGRKATILFH